MKNYLVEFVGTFFLVLTVALSGNPLAIGLSLMVMIYMGGHISGAHYNPAVTIAVWIRGAIAGNQVPAYIVSQVLGSFAASYAAYFISGKALHVAPGAEFSFAQATVAEVLFTFALCSVVLAIATSEKTSGNYVYGWAIGATVIVGAYSVGTISGGAFNPAVGTGPALMDFINGGADFKHVFIYWLGPVAGGLLAAAFFKYVDVCECTSKATKDAT
jgi:aquaporin Z